MRIWRRSLPSRVSPGSVRWRQWVTDQELGALYGGARAFGFLSEYEGLGLTPLEALAAGVPSVLLDTRGGARECGEAALYVRCGDIAATTRALERLLFDPATRAQTARKPRRRCWPDTAGLAPRATRSR